MVGFEAWYRREHPRLLDLDAMSVVCGDLDVARDVTAEAFARALERWDRVETMANPAGWTYTVAVNLARRRWRRRATEDRLAASATPAVLGAFDDRLDVWRAVASLPRQARTAVVLRYFGSMTEDEVAEAMGIAVGTVSSTLPVARRRLAGLLNDTEEVPRA
jgi:RNA polymerase sigma-70 factor (ECF subfamily)